MKKEINVLINYHGKRGSGPSYSLEWAKGLKATGCNVFAVVSQEVANIHDWIDVLGADHIYFIETHKDYSRIDLLIKTIKLYVVGRREIRKKFLNIQFDFSFHTFYCHWANIVDSFLNIKKVVAICHDPIAHSGTNFYTQYLFKRHYRKADDVFTLTKSFRNVVHQQYGTPYDHIYYIPHGRMQMYNTFSKDMYRSLKFSPNKYTFLFFGFIEDYKGLNVLAAAYKIVRYTRNDVRLIVAGNGDFDPYKNAFENLEDVTIVNRYIDDDEVGALFAGPNEIVILPYLDATQSGVIPIAFEFLTPVIASDTGGLKEQLDDGKLGLLFKCGDENDLAKRMIQIVENQDEYKTQQEQMKIYRKSLSWDVLSRKLLSEIGLGDTI